MSIYSDLKEQLALYYDSLIIVIPKLGLALLVCILIGFILRNIRRRLKRFLMVRADDKLLVNFSNSIFQITNTIILFLLFLYIVGQAGIASSILGAVGISAFVIGFALKDIGENFLAGIIMAFNRPFRLGDTVMTGNVEGVVTEMSLRDTHLKTFDGKDVYIPNSQFIKNPLYNYTIDGYLRKSFVIGVDYNSDINRCREILLSVVSKVPGVLNEDKIPKTLIKELGPSTLNIEVQYWINTFNKKYSTTEIQSQCINLSLAALEKDGINLPGNILELKNYGNTLVKTSNQ